MEKDEEAGNVDVYVSKEKTKLFSLKTTQP